MAEQWLRVGADLEANRLPLRTCVYREPQSGVVKVRPGNIGDEGRQEQVVM